ncbi:hypothetical protein AMS68_001783 [Peltaster fructicola]|uniref:Uncharacterized protein n=1 Tax=Peltaster fructicola TaxID=286661 RepID=A0A6H0XNJ4_9PEZI|nr:hypothetical protein AMS68_001783 [Peltaster fructicola]
MSYSRFLTVASIIALLGSRVQAATVNYDWNITWVTASPDGFTRPVIGINGQWPVPLVNVTKGDRIVATIHNMLGNQSTGMHFHGMYQNGTNEMDGAVGVTQCGVPPGSSMTYNFTVDQPGTYWYHSHIRGQYSDGIRGQMVVTDPQSPYKGQYDEEIAFTLSDWYHDQMPDLLSQFISVTNPTGAEPVPDNALMNDTQTFNVSVLPNKTYLFRIANVGAFAGQYFWIEGHNMSVIEVDGIYTEPMTTNMIYLTAAQRYSFLVNTTNDTSTNFAMVGSMDTSLFDVVPDALNWNVTGYVVYNDTADLPNPAEVDDFEPLDDFTLVAQDGMALLDQVDYSVELNLKMDDLSDGANYAFFNDITYVMPKVPTLYTALSSGNLSENAGIYGDDTNAFFLEKGQVVEIVLNNNDAGRHPFHLHGHNFQAVYRGAEDEGAFDPTNATYPPVPMRRDTFMVNPGGNFVIRFVADNPGIWFFHCHIEWHLVTGLAATMIEAAPELQKSLTIPADHYQACKDSNTPYTGNAAGNTVNLLDLSGENTSPAPIPAGFTARGIVALVFSCIAAFLGMAVISWYGAAPITRKDVVAARERIEKAGLSAE